MPARRPLRSFCFAFFSGAENKLKSENVSFFIFFCFTLVRTPPSLTAFVAGIFYSNPSPGTFLISAQESLPFATSSSVSLLSLVLFHTGACDAYNVWGRKICNLQTLQLDSSRRKMPLERATTFAGYPLQGGWGTSRTWRPEGEALPRTVRGWTRVALLKCNLNARQADMSRKIANGRRAKWCSGAVSLQWGRGMRRRGNGSPKRCNSRARDAYLSGSTRQRL